VSLPSLSHTEKLDEIRTSKSDLEHVLDTEVRAFCYPYGDIDADAIDCVRDSGFVCALTVVEEPVVRTSHPLELPRLYVGNWPAEELMHRLETLLQAAP
jgi:peptidoglycan/xylan/chitin deacetylase (PgdA/CDA1 family)